MGEMSKSPEEIKKGLECCSNVNFVCNEECPYYKSLSEGEDCCLKKNADALAYIQQLEAQNAELVRKTEQLQRERDAAVADLKSLQGGQRCERCKNYGGTEFIDAVCIECINGSIWEWHGVQEQPKQEGENDV